MGRETAVADGSTSEALVKDSAAVRGDGESWRLAVFEQIPTAALIMAFVIASFVLRDAWGLGSPLEGLGDGRGYALFPVLVAHALALGYLLRSHRRRSAGAPYRRRVLTFGRLASLLMASVLIPLCLGAYASWKWTIPSLQPFGWDPELHELDRLMHLGALPWQLLQPLLGIPVVTLTLDRLYALWIPISAVVLVWQAFGSRPFARARFFLSYVTVYVVIGTVLAIALSSAGPCYYGLLIGEPDPYAPLMSYLRAVDANTPLLAVKGQGVLWQFYLEQREVPFLSISAMPSVHVAVAVLFALAGWEANRVAGLTLSAYALVVLIGSVHLGWHYAVDGYVAVALTAAIWIGCGAALRAWFRVIRHPDPGPR
jgi:PAP2 superfamily